jgi:hypothetical protein
MLFFNYVNDLQITQGYYPTFTPVELLDFLPDELRNLYFEEINIQGCKVDDLTPRKVRLNFDSSTQDIELPVRPTIQQLRVIKSNSSAIYVETIGERVFYNLLRYQVQNNG